MRETPQSAEKAHMEMCGSAALADGRVVPGCHIDTDPAAESDQKPPKPKYQLTLVIEGNSHDEIEGELLGMTRGGYLLDTDYYKRDECHVVGGRRTVTLVHQNPDMTPEQYDAELDTWWQARRAERRTPPGVSSDGGDHP